MPLFATAGCARVSPTVGSSQLTVICASVLTSVDRAHVLATAVCAHMLTGDAMFRGFGVWDAKSALLFAVSVQPFALRRIALVLLAAGAGALPLKQEAVEP